MAALTRRIVDYLGYVQTWLWIWGIVSASALGIVIWSFITRLPGVVVFVLALGTGVLTLLALETALILYEKIKELRGARYRRAIIALGGLRREGVVLRDRQVLSDADVRVFAGDCDAFQAEALASMRGAATPTDISWFRDLHEWAVPHGITAYNDEHALLKTVLDEKLRRMHVIAGKLDAKIQ